MLLLWSLLPGPTLLTDPLSWLGLVPLALGAWLNVGNALRFHRTGTNIDTFGRPTGMITDGSFRWSRNPMYLGFVLMLVGAGVLMGTLAPLVVAALFAMTCDLWYIRVEERAMQVTFGDAYEAYCQKTRRWI